MRPRRDPRGPWLIEVRDERIQFSIRASLESALRAHCELVLRQATVGIRFA
jgi:tRNA threonylcarbamoyladenosine modification (KEOPS) complex  Pcc1 subunit